MNLLNIVLAEVNLVLAILAQDPKDPRIAQLLNQAKIDLEKASRSLGGDDPLKGDT
jgi:hypothetical protein